MLRAGLFNFSKGEIAPALLGRVDVSALNAGLEKGRNVVALKYGGVTIRPGTRLVAEVYDASKPVRLVPFQFSLEQTYALELGQGYMRPCALGGVVLNPALFVTAITQAHNAQVTANYHGNSPGDQVFFKGISGMTEINGRIATVVSVVDQHNFTIDLDTTGYSAFSGSLDGLVRTGPPDPPPSPPAVPAPISPPPPPIVGGGWGSGYGGYRYGTTV